MSLITWPGISPSIRLMALPNCPGITKLCRREPGVLWHCRTVPASRHILVNPLNMDGVIMATEHTRHMQCRALRFRYLGLMCAISKSSTTAKLLNATNAKSKSTANSSQRRQTRRSARHTVLRCDELTVWRVDWLPLQSIQRVSTASPNDFSACASLAFYTFFACVFRTAFRKIPFAYWQLAFRSLPMPAKYG